MSDVLGFYSENILSTFEVNNTFKEESVLSSTACACFFDRDGVVNLDTGYVNKFQDWNVYPEFLEVLRYLTTEQFFSGIATNQSGISRGLYSWNDFKKFHIELDAFLKVKSLPNMDVIACAWLKEFNTDVFLSGWRKPGPHMLHFLCGLKGVSPQQSIFVGDKTSDMRSCIDAGFAFGVRISDYTNKIISYKEKETTIYRCDRSCLKAVVINLVKNLKGGRGGG